MKYVLGLDIGVASVGWAVLDHDSKRIVDLGVRAFPAAETPKEKAPLAEPRREARLARRRLRRRAGRLRRVKELFIQHGFVPQTQIEKTFLTSPNKPDPWQLRAEGLDRKLSGEEFARVLFHIAKYRGFKSNRKKVQTKEEGPILKCIERNRAVLCEKGYRTVGEMMYKDEEFKDHKRNKGHSYKNTVDRAMLEDEISCLFSAQRRFGSQFATQEIEEKYLELFRWQRPFASGDDILQMVGKCTFEPEEYRAPKCCPTFERFSLLQKLNNLTYVFDSDERRLTPEQKKSVLEKAYSCQELNYRQIREVLDLPGEARFLGLSYTNKKGDNDEDFSCENRVFSSMKGYHSLKKAFEKAGIWDEVKDNFDILDKCAFALTVYKTDEDIKNYFIREGISNEVFEAISSIDNFTKFGHLSLKALRKIIPFLEQGSLYHEACEKAGYNHSNPVSPNRQKKLPVIDQSEFRNAIVLRALSQARKVVNAVIDCYGPPWRIHIELAREMAKPPEKRKEIEREQERNRKRKEEEKNKFFEIFKIEPNSEDLLKFRLYNEQGCKCAYSLKPLDLDRLIEPGYVDIDHILPYSRSFDDSPSNKVLCLTRENREKQNKTPFEYFGSNPERWEKFKGWVNATIKDVKKRRNLLKQNFDERASEEWMNRNLNDTRYIARNFTQFVANNLQFADSSEKRPVVALNGQVVGIARGLWGLKKVREEDDLHHAMDAAVIAALTPGQIKRITEFQKLREQKEFQPGKKYVDPVTGEIIELKNIGKFFLLPPWKHFRKELLARLSENPLEELSKLGLGQIEGAREIKPIIVSRAPRRKARGALHAETIRSMKHISKGISTVRKELKDLKKDDLDKLIAREVDKKLYEAIKKRMEEAEKAGKNPFEEPLYKPTKDGSQGPIVRSVKIIQTQNTGIEVRGGIADNGSMVRIDISRSKNKKGKWVYEATPIYVYDIVRGQLPDLPGEFIFSLYPYDMVLIKRKGEELWGYYRYYDISTKSITISAPNNGKELFRGIGIKRVDALQKYEVGILGDIHLVRSEKRCGMAGNSNQQASENED